ncbi:polypeptide N-acetylgalactosaminyltransferase 5 [Anguilla rostrata]|uniref:polypeptide N-acetylgalactosaminyltransferase 5 n=1 Tax=Anguilla rostrata TaxID=7938 RepID=UPI0030CD8760
MKVRKYFRGSGRVLGFVFIASVIWLLFDMAALKISINDANSQLLKEIIVKQREAEKQQVTKRTHVINRIGFKHSIQKVDRDLETELNFSNKGGKKVNALNRKRNLGPAIKDNKLYSQIKNEESELNEIGDGKSVFAMNDGKEINKIDVKPANLPAAINTKAPIGGTPAGLKNVYDGTDHHKQNLPAQTSSLNRSGLLQNAPRKVPAELPNLTKAPPGVQEEKMQNHDENLKDFKQNNESISNKAAMTRNKVGDNVLHEKQHRPPKDKTQVATSIKPEKEHLKEKDKIVNLVNKQNNAHNKSDPDKMKDQVLLTLPTVVPQRVEIKTNLSRVRKSGTHRVMPLDMTEKPRDGGAIGQFGLPAVVPIGKQEEMRGRWNEGHFNVYLSEQIPVDRAIPDTRPQTCSENLVHDNLPTTSVIFCFVDEVWSTLLRSVHSVLNRSPPHLLKEIILVDDFSSKDYLKDNLDVYMSQFPKVRIIRLKERQGLIRARLAGAAVATGEVLTFLDSHIECNVGWLEPLLERVYIDRRKVACPVIEVINDKDMSYVLVDNFQRGIFKWPLVFGWSTLSEEVIKMNKLKDSDPIRCPVMAGGLFSIDRKYFYELGTYDPGLDVWGGENMELSFKIWMCGGEIEIIPCSRVGHIFRSENPYKFPKNKQKTVERNLARVAEVWLDEYKELFYGHGYHHLLDRKLIDIGNLTDQIQLRQKLKCKSFRWYLENVYPEMDAPLVRAQGLIFNLGARKCLALEKGIISFDTCDLSKQSQLFNHTWMRLLQQQQSCIGVHSLRASVTLEPCDNTKSHLRWLHKSLIPSSALMEHLILQHIPKRTCLEAATHSEGIRLSDCDPGNRFQKWHFTQYFTP